MMDKWAPWRDGADYVAFYRGKKRAFTIYRDLDAVPLELFKAERRSDVPAETGSRPFLFQGTSLIPLENLTEESAERVMKVFGSADVLVRQAVVKTALLHEVPKMESIIKALKHPLKEQN